MLCARSLGKRFGARVVLRDASFEVETGRVLGIAGRNGAGKSTLLRLVCGLIAPSRGTVEWNGNSARGRCALFAPDAPLYRELSCLENLRFWTHEPSDELLRKHLNDFALGGREDDFAGDLSSGLRARLGLCVAAWHAQNGHPILLLDEPTANLDDAGRELVAELVKMHRSRGVVLLASNDARDLEACDELFHIGAGESPVR